MIIWTGHGWIGFVFLVGGLIGGSRLVDYLLEDGYFESHAWPKLAALLACSALCWVTGRRLNKNLPSRIFDVPTRTTRSVQSASSPGGETGHTLAFVRLEYGGLVAAPVYLFIAIEDAGLIRLLQGL